MILALKDHRPIIKEDYCSLGVLQRDTEWGIRRSGRPRDTGEHRCNLSQPDQKLGQGLLS